ncbi:MAG: metalloregulator ArsR/SmtB family transcription factor [Bacteroidota bacterium]
MRALSHPLRLAIIGVLEEKPSMNVNQICKLFEIIQPEASHHLKVLKEAGVLMNSRNGQEMHYFIKPGVLGEIAKCLEKLT